ncbi:MAG: hypothetical protein ABEI86_06570, partial [Halobacteriaceae archaeon]
MTNGGTTYAYSTESPKYWVYTAKKYLRHHLEDGDYEFTHTKTIDGETYAVLESSMASGGSFKVLPRSGQIQGYQGKMYVNSNGKIVKLQYTASYWYAHGHDITRHHGTIKIADLQNKSLARPKWLDEARNQSIQINLTEMRDEYLYKITVPDDEKIPKGSVVREPPDNLWDSTSIIPIPSNVTSEDTLYLTANDEGT